MSTLQKKSLRHLAYTPMIQTNTDFIAHHGILGMHWGIRRFQNKDGSLKPAGKKRYSDNDGEVRDRGLAPGAQNSSSGKGSGLGKVAAAAGIGLAAGASVAPTMAALGMSNKHYSEMDTKELTEDNKRTALERAYRKNHGIKDSPEDVAKSANEAIDAVRKFKDSDKQPSNPNFNRYNTRQTLTQKEMDAMSDQDLQRLVNRMNLETQYSRLTSDPPTKSKVDVGLERTQAVMTIIGSAVTIGAAAYGISRKFGGPGHSVAPTAFELAKK